MSVLGRAKERAGASAFILPELSLLPLTSLLFFFLYICVHVYELLPSSCGI